MKKLIAAAIALSLGGCAGMTRPQMAVMPHKAPIVKAAPMVQAAPVAPPTFKQRFQKFRGRLKWVH